MKTHPYRELDTIFIAAAVIIIGLLSAIIVHQLMS